MQATYLSGLWPPTNAGQGYCSGVGISHHPTRIMTMMAKMACHRFIPGWGSAPGWRRCCWWLRRERPLIAATPRKTRARECPPARLAGQPAKKISTAFFFLLYGLWSSAVPKRTAAVMPSRVSRLRTTGHHSDAKILFMNKGARQCAVVDLFQL